MTTVSFVLGIQSQRRETSRDLLPSLLPTGPPGGSVYLRFCDLVLNSSAHLPEVSAQPAATVPFAALPPAFFSVFTEAPFSKGGGGLDGQELGAAVNLEGVLS